MQDEYKTIAGIATSHLEVKKSRFIGLATAVDSVKKVSDFLDYAKTTYPKATHYCYAYSIGLGDKKNERSSDAGEPNNSAGPPILTAIRSSGLNNVLCVVVRYYGGIKLGIGGLIRAYGKCAGGCLKNAKISIRVFYQKFRIQTPYQQIGKVMNLLNRLQCRIIDVSYDNDARILLQIRQGMSETLQEGLKGIGGETTLCVEAENNTSRNEQGGR